MTKSPTFLKASLSIESGVQSQGTCKKEGMYKLGNTNCVINFNRFAVMCYRNVHLLIMDK